MLSNNILVSANQVSTFFNETPTIHLTLNIADHEVFVLSYMDFFIYRRNCCQFFLADLLTWGVSLGPKLHPGGEFFGPFLILKSLHQLSNEWSNFILSPIEVGHWVAQTSFDKLREITDFGLLQQSENIERFWIC